jgi:hypothetical protein
MGRESSAERNERAKEISVMVLVVLLAWLWWLWDGRWLDALGGADSELEYQD